MVRIFEQALRPFDAIQWKGYNYAEVQAFIRDRATTWEREDDKIWIFAPGSSLRVTVGDWIMKDSSGGFFPCKPDMFQATYDRIKGD